MCWPELRWNQLLLCLKRVCVLNGPALSFGFLFLFYLFSNHSACDLCYENFAVNVLCSSSSTGDIQHIELGG